MSWVRTFFKWLLICFLTLVVLMQVAQSGFPLFEILWYWIFGWVHFIRDNAARIELNPALAAEAIVCLVILSIGTHYFARGLHAQMSAASKPVWPWRWTLGGLAIMLLLFVAGIGTIGVTHQVAWLVNATDPLLNSDSPRAQMSEAILSASACRTSITETVTTVAKLPEAGTWGCESNASTPAFSKYVTVLSTNGSGEIQVAVQNIAKAVNGQAIVLKPWADAQGTKPPIAGTAIIRWDCGPDPANTADIRKYLPASCRADIQSAGGFSSAKLR
jgi:type IV pilus assembly protein PilA